MHSAAVLKISCRNPAYTQLFCYKHCCNNEIESLLNEAKQSVSKPNSAAGHASSKEGNSRHRPDFGSYVSRCRALYRFLPQKKIIQNKSFTR